MVSAERKIALSYLLKISHRFSTRVRQDIFVCAFGMC
jgi:hypothetical protein